MKSSETLLAYLAMPLVIMDENMDVIAASREAFALFGLRPDSGAGQPSLQNLANAMAAKPNLIPAIGALTFKLQHVGSKSRIPWQDESRHFNIEVFTLPADMGMHYGIHFIDITERVELERNLDATRTYLEGILDSIPLGIVVMNRLMQITAMNLRQQDILQMTGQEISRFQTVGMDAPGLFPAQQNPTWEDVQLAVMNDGQLVKGVSRQTDSRGEEKVFSIEVAPLKNAKGDLVGAVRTCADITVQTRMEELTREAGLVIARLELVKQVSVTLHHEINNALAVLMGNLELINRYRESLPEDVLEMLGGIQEQSELIREFVIRFHKIKEIKTVDYTATDDEQMLHV